MTRLLLIGPLPPPMGGDTRHFATLLEDLRANPGFRVTLVNTSRGDDYYSAFHNLRVALRTFWALARHGWRVDVISFQASDRGLTYFMPLVTFFSRLFGKRSIVRVFGGSFGDYFAASPPRRRNWLRRFVLGADVVLLQTQRMIGQLRGQGRGRLEWFSTYIRESSPPADFRRGERCARFVFLGHLWRTKGIETLLGAAARLPAGVGIDVYGPEDEYSGATVDARGAGRVRYRGFLSHAEVERRLWDYDCLVLPTFHEGEGYPGVIAEAFAHGLPVISTRWLAIPEIVDDTCGILVEPNDVDAFVAAVSALHADTQRWQALCDGARARASQFDHRIWARKFETLCEAGSVA
jgi:glycosyltransferase involved in cell wall biosynthesis